ncbi:MAG: prepilin-type N-terminal cleavage/methylation domain-containing protein [Patescibacteria group bacterium]
MIVNFFKFQKGFTMIELLVSVSIIAFLMSIFITNYRGGSRQLELSLAAQKMASDIRLAQSKGLGSAEYNNSVPAGGWGVYFDRSVNDKRYLVFADLNNNKIYDAGEAITGYGGSTVDLPINISISDLKFNVSTTNRLNITFVPPDPTTNIYSSSFSPATTTFGSIVLRESTDNSISTIKVNSFGLIEVQ